MKTWGRPERDKVKVPWSGKIISVQPRIRLTRSFDQRTHSYLGYTLTIQGSIGGEERTFTVGIGKEAQAKHPFKAGEVMSGKSEGVQDLKNDVSGYYKTSDLRVVEEGMEQGGFGPPWRGVPPVLEVYRGRGHRRLDPHLRKQMQGLYLGLSYAGGDDYRPVEPEKEEISIRDLLLRSKIVPVLQGGADEKGTWSGRDGMGGGRLG